MGIGASIAGSVAGAAASKLFGDDGGTRRASRRPPPFFQDALQGSAERLQDARAQQEFVPLDPAQQQGIDFGIQQGQQLASGVSGLDPAQTFQRGRDIFNRTLSGDFLTREGNPALDSQIDTVSNEIQRNFERNVLPQIGSAAQRQGAFGGARQGLAEARAAGEVSREIGDAASRLLGNERQFQQQMIARAPQFAQQESNFQLRPVSILGQAGQRQRQADRQEMQFPLQLESQFGQSLVPLAGAAGGNTVQTRAQPSTGTQLLRGGLGGAQLGNVFSQAFGGGGNDASFGNSNAVGTGSNPLKAGGF